MINATKSGNLKLIKWLFERGCSLQEMNKRGTCIINAAHRRHTNVIIWMLSNGSCVNENMAFDKNRNIKFVRSCKDI